MHQERSKREILIVMSGLMIVMMLAMLDNTIVSPAARAQFMVVVLPLKAYRGRWPRAARRSRRGGMDDSSGGGAFEEFTRWRGCGAVPS